MCSRHPALVSLGPSSMATVSERNPLLSVQLSRVLLHGASLRSWAEEQAVGQVASRWSHMRQRDGA